jgi:pyrimidine operon attenuation protein/uracil phosphoribosyltransferase
LHEGLREKAVLYDRDQMQRAIRRMASEIVARNAGTDGLLLTGIRTRGVPLAERVAAAIEEEEGVAVERGVLDITLYRDDLSTIAPQPVVRETNLPPLDGRTVVLCDDVLYTGRTVRAALDHLADYGRPRRVELAVLIDRGHRELPIQADFVGETVATTANEVIEVGFEETDGHERVRLMEKVED